MEATTLLTILSLLFLSFTPKGECASHGISLPRAVLDLSGNELEKGEYYTLVAWPCKIWPGFGTGSIYPLIYRNGSCWVRHEIAPSPSSLPIKLSPLESSGDEFIRESTPTNIQFSKASFICGGSSVWRVGDHPDQVFGQQFVFVGGQGEDRTTRFEIVKDSELARNNYNLRFCPDDSSSCQYVGIFGDDNGLERLALVDYPEPFGFGLYIEPRGQSQSSK